MQVGGVQGEEVTVIRVGTQKGAPQGVRAANRSEFGEEKL